MTSGLFQVPENLTRVEIGRSVINDDHFRRGQRLNQRAFDGLLESTAMIAAGDDDSDLRRSHDRTPERERRRRS